MHTGTDGRGRTAILVLVASLLLAACAAGKEPRPGPSRSPDIGGELRTVVTDVVDGDTIRVADLDERVRLIGIDAPETRHPDEGVQCFGREAARHLAELVPPGTEVRVEFDVERTDRYGRPLGYVYRTEDDLFVNLAMVEDGYASVLTVPPNVRHAERFLAAQQQARAADHGLWRACGDAP